jgi:hypothetical protein
MAPVSKFRELAKLVLSDLRSYYLFAALLLFSLLSARAAQMGFWALLGHVFLLVLLVGAIVLENKRRALNQNLETCRAQLAELEAKVREQDAILLNQRIQMETERLRPHVEEIQRRLLAEFPHYAASFAVAENNGYVYPNELVLTVKTPDGQDVSREIYNQVLSFARECAKPLDPELAIHWA